MNTNIEQFDVERHRPGFEAAIREINPDVLERWPGGQYKHIGTEGRWKGWVMAQQAKREASTESAKPLTDEAKDAALRDALNTTLWLYRRLPFAYGKPPFVDEAILTMAKHLGMEDVPIGIKERAALMAHTKAQQK